MTSRSHGRTLNSPAGYSGEPEYGRRTLSSKVYVGKIKDNRDILSMGRLRVWIRDLDPDEDHEAGWQTVSYCTPFGGATPIRNRSGIAKSSNTFEDTQKTYGWWGIPPDLDNLVLCVFADGQQSQGFWIGCIFQEQMNSMVPAIGTDDNKVPKAEYNRADSKAAGVERDDAPPDRPEHTTLKEGLRTQGLLITGDKIDFDRGLATASAKRKKDHQDKFGDSSTNKSVFTNHRDQPAKVYGFLSPGGTQFVFDDLENNEYVRLRTKTGAAITIHEGTGFVYMINKDGSAWVELAADGNIDVWSNVSVNIRAQQDINLRADRDILIEAGRDIHMKAVGEQGNGDIKIQSAGDMDTTVGATSRINVSSNYHLNVEVDIKEEALNINRRSNNSMRIQSADYSQNATSYDAQLGAYNLTTNAYSLNCAGNRVTKVGGNESKCATGGISWTSFGLHMVVDDGGAPCDISFGSATSPEAPALAIVPPTNQKININFDSSSKTYTEEKKTTVVSRFPTHEPFPDHIRRARALEIPKNVKTGDSGILKIGATSNNALSPTNFIDGLGEHIGTGFIKNTPLYTLSSATIPLVAASKLGIGAAGLDLIAEKEGFISQALPDVGGGALVIGFGHTLTKEELRTGLINVNGANIKWKDGISKEIGKDLLNQDVTTKFAPIIDQNITVALTQNQKDALISFAYNVGEGPFKPGPNQSTLVKKLNTGDYSSVTDELMRWTYATDPKTGAKIQFNGLITRRQAEADLFSS